jgi:hypothetical protein
MSEYNTVLGSVPDRKHKKQKCRSLFFCNIFLQIVTFKIQIMSLTWFHFGPKKILIKYFFKEIATSWRAIETETSNSSLTKIKNLINPYTYSWTYDITNLANRPIDRQWEWNSVKKKSWNFVYSISYCSIKINEHVNKHEIQNFTSFTL